MDNITALKELLEKWEQETVFYLPKVIVAILVILLFYFIAKALKRYSYKIYSKTFSNAHQIASFISIGIYIFLLLSGVFLALEILGLENTLAKLLASAGVVGIIAGFALKDIASNAFAGFLLNIQRPFKPGDWVSIASNFGTIQKISLVTTSIKNISGQEIFVPNQLIYNNSFTNFSTYNKRRVILSSGVSYGDDLDFVKKVALEEVQKVPSLNKHEEIEFYYTEIGASTFNFEVRFWIDFHHQKDFLVARNDIIMLIKKRFEQEQISIAYSVLSLDFGVKGGVNLFDQSIKTGPVRTDNS